MVMWNLSSNQRWLFWTSFPMMNTIRPRLMTDAAKASEAEWSQRRPTQGLGSLAAETSMFNGRGFKRGPPKKIRLDDFTSFANLIILFNLFFLSSEILWIWGVDLEINGDSWATSIGLKWMLDDFKPFFVWDASTRTLQWVDIDIL